MNKFLNFSEKTSEVICRFFSIIIFIFTVIMVCVMFTQVAYRFFFSKGFYWAEELLRFLFIMMCFLGIPVAFYNNDFSRFDYLQTKLKGNALKISLTLIDIFIIYCTYVMTLGSFTLVKRQMTQAATTLPIPMSFVYAAIPIGGILSIFIIAVKILVRWFEKERLLEEEL